MLGHRKEVRDRHSHTKEHRERQIKALKKKVRKQVTLTNYWAYREIG